MKVVTFKLEASVDNSISKVNDLLKRFVVLNEERKKFMNFTTEAQVAELEKLLKAIDRTTQKLKDAKKDLASLEGKKANIQNPRSSLGTAQNPILVSPTVVNNADGNAVRQTTADIKKFDTEIEQAKETVAILTTQLVLLRKEQAKYRKELDTENGLEGFKRLTKEISDLRPELQRANKDLRSIQKTINTTDYSEGSIKALQASYSQLSETLRRLTPGLDITQKEFSELQQEAFDIQVTIRNFNRSISGSENLVGEYGIALRKVFSEYGGIDILRNSAEKLTQQHKQQKEQISKLVVEYRSLEKEGGAAFEKVRDELLLTQNALNKTEKELKQVADSFDFSIDQNKIRQAFSDAGVKDILQKQANELVKVQTKQRLEVRKLLQEYRKLEKQGGDAFNKVSRELVEAQSKLKATERDVKEVKDALKDAGKQGSKFGTLLKGALLGVGFAGATASIDLLKDAARQFLLVNVEVEKQLANVQKTTTLTRKEARALNDQLLAFNTGTTSEQLRAIAEVAGRLGERGVQNIANFVGATDELVVALGDDLGGNTEDTIRAVGKLVDVFGIKQDFPIAEAVTKVGSAINSLANSGTASAEFLVGFTERLGGIAPQAGISVQNVLGLGTALDELGQSEEVATTALTNFLIELGKSENINKFTQLAFGDDSQENIKKFSILLAKDANEALLKVFEGAKTSDVGLAGLTATLEKLGINGSRAAQIAGVLANNTDLVREKQALANLEFEKGTSLAQEAADKNNTLAASWEQLKKNIEVLSTSEGVTSFFKGVLSPINEVLSKTNEANTIIKNATEEIGLSFDKLNSDSFIQGGIIGFFNNTRAKAELVDFNRILGDIVKKGDKGIIGIGQTIDNLTKQRKELELLKQAGTLNDDQVLVGEKLIADKIGILREQLKNLVEQRSKIRLKLEQENGNSIEKGIETIDSLDEALKKLTEKRRSLPIGSSDLKEVDAQIENLRAKLDQVNGTKTEVKTENKEIETSLNTIEGIQNTLQILREQRITLDIDSPDFQSTTEEIKQLEKKLADINNQKTVIEIETGSVQDLRNELSDIEKKILQTSNTSKQFTLIGDANKVKEQLDDLNEKLTLLREASNDINFDITFSDNIDENISKLDAAIADLEAKREQAIELGIDTSKFDKELDNLDQFRIDFESEALTLDFLIDTEADDIASKIDTKGIQEALGLAFGAAFESVDASVATERIKEQINILQSQLASDELSLLDIEKASAGIARLKDELQTLELLEVDVAGLNNPEKIDIFVEEAETKITELKARLSDGETPTLDLGIQAQIDQLNELKEEAILISLSEKAIKTAEAFSILSASFDGFARSMKEGSEAQKVATKIAQAFAVAQQAAALSATIFSIAKEGLKGFPAAIGTIATLSAQIFGTIAAARTLFSTQLADGGDLEALSGGYIPKRGGMIQGNSHAQGGVKFNYKGKDFEAEGGELLMRDGKGKRVVVNKYLSKAMIQDPIMRQMLESINFDFSKIAKVEMPNYYRHFASGGFLAAAANITPPIINKIVPTNTTNTANEANIKRLQEQVNFQNETITALLQNMNNMIVVNNVTDSNKLLEEEKRIQNTFGLS
ncbi:MAG: phage tail tape measure protein [Chitinophagales bacterium]